MNNSTEFQYPVFEVNGPKRFIVSKIFSSPLLIIGLIGNSLSFVIFNKKSMKGTTTSIYLRAMAISDSGTLIFWFIFNLFYTAFAILGSQDLIF